MRVTFVTSGDLSKERSLIPTIVENASQLALLQTKTPVISREWHDCHRKGRGSSVENYPDFMTNDLVVMVLWKYWGEKTGKYSSHFKRVYLSATKKAGAIWLYFRDIPDRQLIHPDEQLERAISFRDMIERDNARLFFGYENEAQWRKMIDRHLRLWIEGKKPQRQAINALPDHHKRMAGWTNTLKNVKGQRSKAAFHLARKAFNLARGSRLTKACQAFALAVQNAPEPYIINEYGIFLKENGFLNKSKKLFARLSRIGQRMGDKLVMGSAQRHLGHIEELRGKLPSADLFYQEALSMEEGFDRKLKQANLYEARGRVNFKLGSLETAKEMYEKAVAIFNDVDLKEGAALIYYSLTELYIKLGDIGNAIDTGNKAQALFKRLGELNMARQIQARLNGLLSSVD